MKKVSLLGATGSIGDSAIDVLKQHSDQFQIHSIAARSQWKKVFQLAKEFNIKHICITTRTISARLSTYTR